MYKATLMIVVALASISSLPGAANAQFGAGEYKRRALAMHKILEQELKRQQKRTSPLTRPRLSPRLNSGQGRSASDAAQYNLGMKYHQGNGVKQDFTLAAPLFRKAAEQDHTKAQYCLGVMYSKGQGMKQNYHEALFWFRKAAGKGNAKAQYNLGAMYENGMAVKQNSIQAYQWFKRAAMQGLAPAIVQTKRMEKEAELRDMEEIEERRQRMRDIEKNSRSTVFNVPDESPQAAPE